MSNVARFSHSPPQAIDAGASPLSQSVVDAIKMLVGGLSDTERARVLAEITELIRPIPAHRAGDVLGAVIRFLPKLNKPEGWTVDEVKKHVANQGVEAPAKDVYNAIGYLAKKGHIQRIGYGRYIVAGAELVTSEDFGGANTRHEDEYRNTTREDGK